MVEKKSTDSTGLLVQVFLPVAACQMLAELKEEDLIPTPFLGGWKNSFFLIIHDC